MTNAILKRGRRRAVERFAGLVLDVVQVLRMNDRVAKRDHFVRRVIKQVGDARAHRFDHRAAVGRLQPEDDLVDVLQHDRVDVPRRLVPRALAGGEPLACAAVADEEGHEGDGRRDRPQGEEEHHANFTAYLPKMPFSPLPMAPKTPWTARCTRCFIFP